MAKESPVHATASLRALTYRISSCPPPQLPHLAPQITASLWNSRATLAAVDETAKSTSDATQAAHRFRATLSQLLQARTVEERWAAVVLVKAAIEAGGAEAISKAAGWTKSLIAILKKSDPPTTKSLAIITLTRIFTLTWHDTNLVREITTPSLPGFLQACLTALEKAAVPGSTLQCTLGSFATLLPRHPTVFRTYEGQIRALLLKILSSTPSNSRPESIYSEAHRDAASRLLALLHHCAPKQGGPEKWNASIKAAVTAAHAACDRIFRSINETWQSHAGVEITKSAAGQLESSESDAVGLSPWQGMHAGAERLRVLLDMLSAHTSGQTSSVTSIPLGIVFDLLQRLLDLHSGMREQSSYFDHQVPKDEREQLFEVLPGIHTSVVDLLNVILDRLDITILSTLPFLIEPICTVFTAECKDPSLRARTYRLMEGTISHIGPNLTKDSLADLSVIMRSCCDDILPANRSGQDGGHSQPAKQAIGVICKEPASPSQPKLSDVQTTASGLLPVLFSKLDQSRLPSRLRVKMEQTALLTRHKDALVASILNPAKKSHGTSPQLTLLPLLAREFPDCAEVQALLRPRFPVIGTSQPKKTVIEEEERSTDSSSEDERDDGEGLEREMDDGLLVNGLPNQPSPLPSSHNNLRSSGTVPDEVFSTAPEQASQATAWASVNKRPATDSLAPQEADAKRLRASPVTSALATDTSPTGWDASVASAKAEEAPGAAAVSRTMHSETAALPAQDAVTGDDEEGTDESDFEIPPLTMESDSEVETS